MTLDYHPAAADELVQAAGFYEDGKLAWDAVSWMPSMIRLPG